MDTQFNIIETMDRDKQNIQRMLPSVKHMGVPNGDEWNMNNHESSGI